MFTSCSPGNVFQRAVCMFLPLSSSAGLCRAAQLPRGRQVWLKATR